jgi:thiamine-phosphate pyrophosphorylase
MLAEVGVKLIQYRHKQATPRDYFHTSLAFANFFRPRSIRFVVNDRPDIAMLVGAGGVHVGQEDLPVEQARRVVGATCWVGVSTHNEEQLRRAAGTSADYVAVGPVFPTTTKQRPDPVVGVEFIQQARRLTAKPIVAIGGITLERAEAVWRAGADSVAVAADLLHAKDPAGRARQYLELAETVFGRRD